MPQKAWQKNHLEKIATKIDLDMKLHLNELLGIPRCAKSPDFEPFILNSKSGDFA
jgi:hypothetical protein